MQLTETSFSGVTPIDGYGPGFFRVGGVVVEGPVLLFPTYRLAWGGLGDLQSILDRAAEMDVLFIGTGASLAPLPAAFRDPLREAGLGLEPMPSPSACRTYNVLLSEGRRVAAALLPV